MINIALDRALFRRARIHCMTVVTPGDMGCRRLPIVGVMGSATDGHAEKAEPLGRRLAELGVHLLTGGGGGAMESVSRGFSQVRGRAGLVLGILPCRSDDAARAPEGYPNRWTEIAIRTHLPARGDEGASLHSRNHLNVLTADAVVALPGGAGTSSEVRLALTYRRPVVAHVESAEQIPDLPASVPLAPTLVEVERLLREWLDLAAPAPR